MSSCMFRRGGQKILGLKIKWNKTINKNEIMLGARALDIEIMRNLRTNKQQQQN